MNTEQKLIAGYGLIAYFILLFFTLLSTLHASVGLFYLTSLLRSQSSGVVLLNYSYSFEDTEVGLIINKTDSNSGCLVDYLPKMVVFVDGVSYIGVNTSLYVPSTAICRNLRVDECMYVNKNPPKFYSYNCSGMVVKVLE